MIQKKKKGQSLVEYALIIAVIAAAAITALNLIKSNIMTSANTVSSVLQTANQQAMQAASNTTEEDTTGTTE